MSESNSKLEEIRERLVQESDYLRFGIISDVAAIDTLRESILLLIDAITALPPPPNPHSEKVS